MYAGQQILSTVSQINMKNVNSLCLSGFTQMSFGFYWNSGFSITFTVLCFLSYSFGYNFDFCVKSLFSCRDMQDQRKRIYRTSSLYVMKKFWAKIFFFLHFIYVYYLALLRCPRSENVLRRLAITNSLSAGYVVNFVIMNKRNVLQYTNILEILW